ncbi:MAG: PTS fructose transporter subunit IIA [Rhizobiales bacterium]|nr:PTS fructose transporter subunit IIA [Hyphomicrobiales bacterium]
MIGMVIVTHGRLAQEFLAALEHVVGPQPRVATVSIGPDDDMEARRNEILECVRATDEGQGVVLLTDLFGGTPSNLAISLMDVSKVEVVAGVNLPLLVKLATLRRDHSIGEAVAAASDAGRRYISVASEVLAHKQAAGTS